MSDTKKITITILSLLLFCVVVITYSFTSDSDSEIKSKYEAEPFRVKITQASAISSLNRIESKLKSLKTTINYFELYFDSLSTQKITYSKPEYVENRISLILGFPVNESRYKIEEIQNSLDLDSTTNAIAYELSKTLSGIKLSLYSFSQGGVKRDLEEFLELQDEITNSSMLRGIIKSEIISDANISSYEIVNYSTMRLAILTTEVGKYSGPGSFEVYAIQKTELRTQLSNGFTTNVPVYIEIDLDEKKTRIKELYQQFSSYRKKMTTLKNRIKSYETDLNKFVVSIAND